MGFLSREVKRIIYLALFITLISSFFMLIEIWVDKWLIEQASTGSINVIKIAQVLLIYGISYLLYYFRLISDDWAHIKVRGEINRNHFSFLLSRKIEEFMKIRDIEESGIIYTKKIPFYINEFISELYDFSYETLFLILGTLYLGWIDYKIMVVCIGFYFLSYFLIGFVSKRNERKIEEISISFSEYTQEVSDSIDNTFQLQSFNLYEQKKESISKLLDKYLYSTKWFNINKNVFFSFQETLNHLREWSLLFLTLYLQISNVGSLFIILYISSMLSEPVKRWSGHLQSMKSTKALRKELAEEKNKFNSYKPSYLTLNQIKEIKYYAPKFCIEDKILLENIELHFKSGKKYLIQGDNGSGKTSLIKDILCIAKYGGKTIVDNIEILNEEQLFDNYLYISQENPLFQTNIINNITLFEEKPNKELLEQIIKDLNIRKDIEDITKISGGEKQKILVGRALYHNFPLLIMDESFSSIDKKSSVTLLNILIENYSGILIMVEHHLPEEFYPVFDNITYLAEYAPKKAK